MHLSFTFKTSESNILDLIMYLDLTYSIYIVHDLKHLINYMEKIAFSLS